MGGFDLSGMPDMNTRFGVTAGNRMMNQIRNAPSNNGVNTQRRIRGNFRTTRRNRQTRFPLQRNVGTGGSAFNRQRFNTRGNFQQNNRPGFAQQQPSRPQPGRTQISFPPQPPIQTQPSGSQSNTAQQRSFARFPQNPFQLARFPGSFMPNQFSQFQPQGFMGFPNQQQSPQQPAGSQSAFARNTQPQASPQMPRVSPQLPQISPRMSQVRPQMPQVNQQTPQVPPQMSQVPQMPQIQPQMPQMQGAVPQRPPATGMLNPGNPFATAQGQPQPPQAPGIQNLPTRQFGMPGQTPPQTQPMMPGMPGVFNPPVMPNVGAGSSAPSLPSVFGAPPSPPAIGASAGAIGGSAQANPASASVPSSSSSQSNIPDMFSQEDAFKTMGFDSGAGLISGPGGETLQSIDPNNLGNLPAENLTTLVTITDDQGNILYQGMDLSQEEIEKIANEIAQNLTKDNPSEPPVGIVDAGTVNLDAAGATGGAIGSPPGGAVPGAGASGPDSSPGNAIADLFSSNSPPGNSPSGSQSNLIGESQTFAGGTLNSNPRFPSETVMDFTNPNSPPGQSG